MSQKSLIEPIRIDSYESIIKSVDDHIETFREDSVIVYRGARISRQEQLEIFKIFGDAVGWAPNSKTGDLSWRYDGNHVDTINALGKKEKTEILIDWHLEHMGFPNPAIGASWNMESMSCPNDVGTTMFVNTSDIYDLLADDEKEFLRLCKVSISAQYVFESDAPENPSIYDAIQFHAFTGRNVVRLGTYYEYTESTHFLREIAGRKPTEEESHYFNKLSSFFRDNIHHNEQIKRTHMWDEGDLLIVDLFSMAHAVNGGFEAEERVFNGYWAHKYPFSKYGN